MHRMLQRPRAVLKWLPYVLPMAMFLVLSMPEQLLGSYGYPAAYTIKIIAITTLLWTLRRFYPELKRNWTGVALSLMLGPLLTLAWIVIDRITPHFSFLGTRSEFDSFEVFSHVIFRRRFADGKRASRVLSGGVFLRCDECPDIQNSKCVGDNFRSCIDKFVPGSLCALLSPVEVLVKRANSKSDNNLLTLRRSSLLHR